MSVTISLLSIASSRSGTPTLKDDQTRYKPRIRLLDLLNLRLETLPDTLCDGRAINLGSRHGASGAIPSTMVLRWKILWWWIGGDEQRGTITAALNPTCSSKLTEGTDGGA